jgi:hypothetical protein
MNSIRTFSVKDRFLNRPRCKRGRAGAYFWKYFASGNTGTVPGFAISSTWNLLGLTAINCNLGTPDASCETFGGDGFPHLKAYQTERRTAKAEANGYKAEYNTAVSNLDNGQQNTLLMHLTNSSYSNDTLADELLAAGLLSDTVLKRVAARYPAFSESRFVAIMNHNSPVSEKVWKEVSKTISGFSSNNRDSVANAQKTDTVRTLTIIKGDINRAETKQHQAIRQILGYYSIADTTEAVHDTLMILLIDTLDTKPFRKLAIGYGIEIGRIGKARAILDTLTLTSAHDTSFYNYYDLALSLAEDSLTWFSMDSTQKEKVKQVANTKFDEAYLAQAVLSLLGDTLNYRNPEPLPEDSAQFRIEDTSTIDSQQQSEPKPDAIKVYPNPFSDSFNVDYLLEDENMKLAIEVYDIVGKTVRQITTLATKTGVLTVDIEGCLGVYFVRVIVNDQPIKTQKMICISK